MQISSPSSGNKSTIVRLLWRLFHAWTRKRVGPTDIAIAGESLASVGAPAAPPAEYPLELVQVVSLRDGATVRLRPIRPDDEPGLEALFGRLSPQSVYQRFFAWHRRLPQSWYHEFSNVDYTRRFALVAEEAAADGIRLRGVARWEPSDEDEAAEMAIVIEDAWQGRGLGTVLLRRLLEIGANRGIHLFVADVLAENERMLRTLRTLTDIRTSSASHGVIHLCVVPREEVATVP